MAKYPFLSDEWVKEARRIYAGAGIALDVGASAAPVRVNLVVTEVPFSERPLDAHLDTTDGKVAIDTGHLPEADVTVSMDYATARTLFVGGDVQAVMQAFLAGRVRVDGDLSKLLDPRSGIWPGSLAGAPGGWGAPQAGPNPGQGATATPSTANPSTANPSTANPSTATPSTATPSTATPSTATPSNVAPVNQPSLGFPTPLQLASQLQEITE